MEIIERISEVVKTSKISISAFARKCGIKQQTLSSQINGTRELGLSTVVAVLATCKDISAEWLMRGEGAMHKDETPATPASEDNFDRLMKLVDTIATLQDALNIEKQTNALYKERIAQLENQLKIK